MRNLKKKAFTIAELVIAMMVVAAIGMILMPTLMADNEKQVLKVSLEKSYATLRQSAQAASLLAAQGKIVPGTASTAVFMSSIAQTQKLMRETKQDIYLANYEPVLIAERGVTTVLKNSIIIMVDTSAPPYIVVDVNGTKQPNKVGRDIYYFTTDLADNGELIFNPVEYDTVNNNCNKDGTPDNNIGCADFILNYNGKL